VAIIFCQVLYLPDYKWTPKITPLTQEKNALAYSAVESVTNKKGFVISLSPLPNVLKLFTSVNYECSEKARVLVPGKPLKPSLMFASKAGLYSSEEPFRCSTLEWLLASPANIRLG